MKPLAMALAALAAVALLGMTWQQAERPCCGLTCQPYAETCPACKDCTACRACHIERNQCSVCRNKK